MFPIKLGYEQITLLLRLSKLRERILLSCNFRARIYFLCLTNIIHYHVASSQHAGVTM
jgi:hypothetical protein